MKSSQAFPFIAFEKLVKKCSVLLTCTHEATTLPESCVCIPLSLCLRSILLECNACAHTHLPLVLSPPSLPALTLIIPNLQVFDLFDKRKREKNRVKTCACEENEPAQLMVESWTWDQKVMGSSPGRNGWGIFFCRVNFLCSLLILVFVSLLCYCSSIYNTKDPSQSSKSAGGSYS